MSDILPVSLQNILHSWKPKLRKYKITDVIQLTCYNRKNLSNDSAQDFALAAKSV